MVDRLEVTVHGEIPLRAEIASSLKFARRLRSPLYQEALDLRPLNIPAYLYRRCRFNRTQKLILKNVSTTTLRVQAATVGQVFDCDPWEARIARIDCAVDLSNVSINWVREHTFVPHKRRVEERGSKPGQIGTLYFGAGADLFRSYDKKAQLQRVRSDIPLITGKFLTRIERQMRSGRIPPQISTLADLAKNGPSFNPFAQIKFIKGGKLKPRAKDYTFSEYLKGIGLRSLIERHGLGKCLRLLSDRRRNSNCMVTRLADFVPPDLEAFDQPDLLNQYRASLTKQIDFELGCEVNDVARNQRL